MRSRKPIGMRLEGYFNPRIAATLRRRGWTASVVPYVGYGNTKHLRIMGRTVLTPPAKPRPALGLYARHQMMQRGWRHFVQVTVPECPVRVTVADQTIQLHSDRGGYVDLRLQAELAPGWHHIQLQAEDAEPTRASILVVDAQQRIGLISDIDDTIITTYLPRLFIAAWNSLVLTEGARQAVPGMARMYQRFQAAHPGAPIVYVSTGSWNTLPFLSRFMKRNGFPKGPILLTDWGLSNSGISRTGREHKRYALGELARDFPSIKWILVGDNGQHDPTIYRDFAELRPDHVRAILIRRLAPTEQVLAHGTTNALHDSYYLAWSPPPVPEFSGADGDDLSYWLSEVTDQEPPPRR